MKLRPNDTVSCISQASLRKIGIGQSSGLDETCNDSGRNGKVHTIGYPE